MGLHQIGKLRRDANLRYFYQGLGHPGPGRPKTYDGKVQWDDLSRFEWVHSEDDDIVLYHQVLNHVHLRRNPGSSPGQVLRVVLVVDTRTQRRAVLFSTDTDLDAQTLYRGYKARFQIEFLFRDAKQFTSLSACPDARWTAWGKAAATRFRGAAANLSIDGEVVTGTIGLDYERWRSLAGVALSHSGGTGTYPVRGGGGLPARLVDVESALTSVHPYVRLALHDGLSAWGVLGYGQGYLSLIGEGPRLRTGIEMNIGALGVRGALLSAPGAKGFVAVKSDVFMVRMKSDAADGLLPVNVYVSRLRLGLEGSYRFAFGGGKSLAPSFEIGLRHDGGDAERGFGVEIGGGLTYASPASGLKVELQGRVLLAHEASGFRDVGISGRLHYATASDAQLGPSLVLRSSWGGSAAGGVEALWGGEAMAGLTHPNGAQGSRLDGEIAYGLRTLNGQAVGTPYAGMGLSDSGRDYRVGYRLGLTRRAALNFELGLEGTRRESAHANEPEHGVMLRGTLGW